jgi:hypothetical protein
VVFRSSGPAKCVGSEFASRADELTEGTTVHARDVDGRHLDEAALGDFNIHDANLVDAHRAGKMVVTPPLPRWAAVQL